MQQFDTLADHELDSVTGGVMDNPFQDYSNWQHSVTVGAWSPFGFNPNPGQRHPAPPSSHHHR